MTWDCFTFFNEIELLKFRMHVLADVVDKFVIVEAGWCHSGSSKALHLKSSLNELDGFEEKIIYRALPQKPVVPTNIAEHEKSWFLENYQRNAIKDALLENGLSDSDLVLISDLDEIPDPHKVSILHDIATKEQKIAVCKQMHCRYAFNNAEVNDRYAWTGTRACSGRFLKNGLDNLDFVYSTNCLSECNQGTTATKIRFTPWGSHPEGYKKYSPYYKFVDHCGWHFSYLAPPSQISTKLKSYSHVENNNEEFVNLAHIKKRIQSGHTLDNRWWVLFEPLKLDKRFPQYLLQHQQYYANFIFPHSFVKSTKAIFWKCASKIRRTLLH